MGNTTSLRRAIQDERWDDVRRILGSQAAQSRVRTKWYTIRRGDKLSVTALHILCLHHAPPDIVNLMLRIGPNLLSQKSSPGGELPLHFAVKNPRRTNLNLVWTIAKAYPPAVAERSSRTKGAQTPLHVACAAAAPVAWIRLLYETNPSARDVLDGEGRTPWETTKASTGCWRFIYRNSVRKVLKNSPILIDLEEEPGVVEAVAVITGTDAFATDASVRGETEHFFQSGDSAENGLCVVCWDECANYAVIPCGHLCLCAHCGIDNVRHLNGKCPVCNRRMGCTVRIYQSGVHTPVVSPSAPLEYSDH